MQNVYVQPAGRTGRPSHRESGRCRQCRGHVHAPYTSPGSGVAGSLKDRYTHRELRWGRPTARPAWAWVTPPHGGSSFWGDEKIETEGDPARRRMPVGRRVRLRGRSKSGKGGGQIEGQRDKTLAARARGALARTDSLPASPFALSPSLSLSRLRLPDFSFGASRQSSWPGGHPPGDDDDDDDDGRSFETRKSLSLLLIIPTRR